VTVVWIPDLSIKFCELCFEFLQELRMVWEAISKTRKSLSSGIQTPLSRSKKLGCTSFFQPPSRGLDILMKHFLVCDILHITWQIPCYIHNVKPIFNCIISNVISVTTNLKWAHNYQQINLSFLRHINNIECHVVPQLASEVTVLAMACSAGIFCRGLLDQFVCVTSWIP